MNIIFSEKEKRKLLEFINKKPLNEQKWLDDIITSAKNANTSFLKSSPKIFDQLNTVVTSTLTKNLDEIKAKLSRVENSLNSKTLFKADDINSSINLWSKTISDYTRAVFKNSNMDLDILVKYVTGELNKLPDDIFKNLNDNQKNILFNLRAQNDLFKIEASEMATNYKKLLTDKAKKYIEIHGQEKYNKLSADYKSKKIDTEGLFKELENTTPTKETPKQVAGVKLSDIPKDEFDVIEASFRKYGFEKSWGFDPNTGDPVYVLLNIKGEQVKFSLNSKGPEQFDFKKINKDDLYKKYESEYLSSGQSNQISLKSYVEQKILNDTQLSNDYVYRYDVSLGVHYKPNGETWIIVNPEAIKNYRKPKNTEEFKNSVYHTTYHELVHEIQPVKDSYISDWAYKSEFKTGQDALDYLKKTREREFPTSGDEYKSLKFDAWYNENSDEALKILDEFEKSTGISPTKDNDWLIEFEFWVSINNKIPDKFYDLKKIPGEKKVATTRIYGNDVVIRAFKNTLEGYKDTDIGKKIKTKTDGMSNEQILKFMENNVNDPDISEILKRSANKLGYWSHQKEIEAEFGGMIKSLLELGTLEQNKGLATWLVDWLKGGDKLKKVKDFKSSTPNLLDKLSDQAIKEYFRSFFKKFLGKNPDEVKKVDSFINQIPKDFWDVLYKLENEWKEIYPEQAKKMYNDLYKQAYELISKGYPALLPFIAGELSELGGSEEGSVKNESIRYKKSYITEGIKKTYSFDWDDNILNMPTRIHLEYKVGGLHWVPVSVSTEQFRSIRHKLGTEFRYLNENILDAFKDFREYEPFIRDVKIALDSRRFGPSFNDFKEALINGEDFSIITARSNSPKYFIEAIKLIIDHGLSYSEKMEMISNLKGTSVEDYLKIQDYYPVTSDEFLQSFNLDVNVSSPEVGKEIAFESFVDKVVNQIEKIKDDPSFEGISVGYSDDDPGNIEVIINLIKSKLSKKYPQIHFNIYDTSDPNNPKKKRIVIEK